MKKMKTMTEGVIWKEILFFAIPLILGNLFQQLYNTVDSIIVGNYVGSNALAAVGSSGGDHQSADRFLHRCINRRRSHHFAVLWGEKCGRGKKSGTYHDGDRAGSRSASDSDRNCSDTGHAPADGDAG